MLINDIAEVIYHKNCTDGFASAWAFNKLMRHKFKDVRYHPMNYDDPIPPITPGSSVYILDFSLPKDSIRILCDKCGLVLILDHHQTARDNLSGWLDEPKNFYFGFDNTKSGALITWIKFAIERDTGGELIIPDLIRYISDRDLWKFELPDSKIINEYINSWEFDFESWDKLAELDLTSTAVRLAGSALMVKRRQIVNQIVETCARKILIDGVEGLVCNCSPQFSSEVGHALVTQSNTYGATYFQDSKGNTRFSLRSSGQVDVAKLAEKLGGGGHKNASGFILTNPSPGNEIVTVWEIPNHV